MLRYCFLIRIANPPYGLPLTDSDEIVNEFNNYFANIGRLLSEQITSPHTSEEYLSDRPKVSFKFSPVSEDRTGNIIKHLKSKSSYGYDEISNNLIKHANNSLIKPLTLIVNQALHTGIFPRQLKLSLPLSILRYKKIPFLEFLCKAIKKDSHLRIFTR